MLGELPESDRVEQVADQQGEVGILEHEGPGGVVPVMAQEPFPNGFDRDPGRARTTEGRDQRGQGCRLGPIFRLDDQGPAEEGGPLHNLGQSLVTAGCVAHRTSPAAKQLKRGGRGDPFTTTMIFAGRNRETTRRRATGLKAGSGKVGIVKVVFVGDVVGSPGRRGLRAAMPELRERFTPDLVIVNGETSAGGVGITPATAGDLFEAGADVITLGNHAYRHREAFEFLDGDQAVIRPSNFRRSNPGRGSVLVEAGGLTVAVVNLIGKIGLDAARSPFDEADLLIEELGERADAVVVDFHAEVTSEKVALGWYLDGRVAAVLGTHTHVPTADGRILPGGTAYISDVGMTGSRNGVLGVDRDVIIERMRTGLPARFTDATGDVWVMGAAVEIAEDGLATSIDPFQIPATT